MGLGAQILLLRIESRRIALPVQVYEAKVCILERESRLRVAVQSFA